MTTDIGALLDRTRPVVDARPLLMAGLRPADVAELRTAGLVNPFDGFSSVLATGDEVTIITDADRVDLFRATFPHAKVGAPFHSVTLEVEGEGVPWDVVGYLSHVLHILAEAGVPVFALSAARTDHLLVHGDHLEAAMAALEAELAPPVWQEVESGDEDAA